MALASMGALSAVTADSRGKDNSLKSLNSISLKSLLLVKSRRSTAFFYSQSRYYKAQAIELSFFTWSGELCF